MTTLSDLPTEVHQRSAGLLDAPVTQAGSRQGGPTGCSHASHSWEQALRAQGSFGKCHRVRPPPSTRQVGARGAHERAEAWEPVGLCGCNEVQSRVARFPLGWHALLTLVGRIRRISPSPAPTHSLSTRPGPGRPLPEDQEIAVGPAMWCGHLRRGHARPAVLDSVRVGVAESITNWPSRTGACTRTMDSQRPHPTACRAPSMPLASPI